MAAQPAGRSHPASGERLQHLMDAADALRRVAGLVARRAAPRETLSAIAQELARFLGADFTSLLRYEPDGTAVIAGWWGPSGVDVPLGTRLTVAGEDVAVSVLATGQPAWTDRFDGPAGSVAARFRRLAARSAVGAPIMLEGRLWGVAIAAASQPGRLPAGSEWRIAGLTELVGAVIADTQARVDLQHVADEQAALRRGAGVVAGSASPAAGLSARAGEGGAPLRAHTTILPRVEPPAPPTIPAGAGARDP